jgi:hypothetical protein
MRCRALALELDAITRGRNRQIKSAVHPPPPPRVLIQLNQPTTGPGAPFHCPLPLPTTRHNFT